MGVLFRVLSEEVRLIDDIKYMGTMNHLYIFTFVFLTFSHGCFSKPNVPGNNDPGVVVSLYYESLCPYCKSWITDELIPSFQKLQQYMTVEFIPYGNAHQREDGDSWSFTCQHGPTECTGNIQQSCLLKYVPQPNDFIYAIHCIEESGDVTWESNIRKCLQDFSQATAETIDMILECSTSEEGVQLHHEMGVVTENLRPEHEYVPWVTFNHEHSENSDTEDCQFDLFNCLCSDYLKGVPECDNYSKKNVCPKKLVNCLVLG